MRYNLKEKIAFSSSSGLLAVGYIYKQAIIKQAICIPEGDHIWINALVGVQCLICGYRCMQGCTFPTSLWLEFE